jgi:hypothetical protein
MERGRERKLIWQCHEVRNANRPDGQEVMEMEAQLGEADEEEWH